MRIGTLLAFLMICPAVLPAQDAATKVKTVPVKPTSPASGKEMFNAYCASCHGVDAKGNGPAAGALKKQPADLTMLARNSGGKYPAMRVMSTIQDGTQSAHGSKEMPVWGPVLLSVSNDRPATAAQRISNLNAYIESLQVK
jgi:mono/diheme cytochrome c family protein